MAKREVCMCEKCANEAEMTITCQTVEVGGVQEKRETLECSACGNKTERTV